MRVQKMVLWPKHLDIIILVPSFYYNFCNHIYIYMYYIIVRHIDILHTGIWHIPICIVLQKALKEDLDESGHMGNSHVVWYVWYGK